MNSKMRTKIITAVVLLAAALPCIIIGGTVLKVLLAVVAALAAYEIASLADQKPHWIFTGVTFAAIVGLSVVKNEMYSAVCAIWLLVLFVKGLIDEHESVDHVVYAFVMSILLSLAVRCILRMYSVDGLGVLALAYVAIACYLTDTMAYFFGVSLGKHKMIPRVSPNKTWEGSIGGYCSGALLSLVFGLFFCKTLPTALVICASLVLPLTAQVGDLGFSLIKRRFGIKDFGKAFPEHGGIFDRIDSLIFCLMLFNALMLMWGIA